MTPQNWHDTAIVAVVGVYFVAVLVAGIIAERAKEIRAARENDKRDFVFGVRDELRPGR